MSELHVLKVGRISTLDERNDVIDSRGPGIGELLVEVHRSSADSADGLRSEDDLLGLLVLNLCPGMISSVR